MSPVVGRRGESCQEHLRYYDGGRVGSMSPFSQHPPSLVGRLSLRILPFQNMEGPREKTERDPVPDWTSWSHWAPCLRLCPPLMEGPHEGAEAAVDHTNERWDRLYWMIFNGCGLLKGRRGAGGFGMGEWVTGLVNQSVWRTDELWEEVTEAMRGLHGPTWGPFIGLSNCWPCHPPSQETLWQLKGEILSVWKKRGQGNVGVCQRMTTWNCWWTWWTW